MNGKYGRVSDCRVLERIGYTNITRCNNRGQDGMVGASRGLDVTGMDRRGPESNGFTSRLQFVTYSLPK